MVRDNLSHFFCYLYAKTFSAMRMFNMQGMQGMANMQGMQGLANMQGMQGMTAGVMANGFQGQMNGAAEFATLVITHCSVHLKILHSTTISENNFQTRNFSQQNTAIPNFFSPGQFSAMAQMSSAGMTQMSFIPMQMPSMFPVRSSHYLFIV